jgi:predicted dehydrogenase
MTKRDEVRVGVIGIGTMGAAHARDLQTGKVSRAVLAALADSDGGALARISGAERFRDGKTLIDSGLVDAVVIATPHPDHPVNAVAALEAGLHVLVEKPLAAHKADCETVIAAYARRSSCPSIPPAMARSSPTWCRGRDRVKDIRPL